MFKNEKWVKKWMTMPMLGFIWTKCGCMGDSQNKSMSTLSKQDVLKCSILYKIPSNLILMKRYQVGALMGLQ